MLLALKHLAKTSVHEVVRSQARGALWILEGKEQQMPPVSSEVSSTAAGTFFTSFVGLYMYFAAALQITLRQSHDHRSSRPAGGADLQVARHVSSVWLGSKHQVEKVTVHNIPLLQSSTTTVDTERDLGMMLDSQLTISARVGAVCRSAYKYLRQLRPVVRALSVEAKKTV